MTQQPEDDLGGRIAEKLMHVDVRIAGANNHETTQQEIEQRRIDWEDQNSANMKKMTNGEITPIYH